MRKRMKIGISTILVLTLLLCLIPTNIFADSSQATAKNEDGFLAPIENRDISATPITTAEELSNIRNDLYGNYYLANDIDLSSYGNWTPIGSGLSTAFVGKLDGQGHTIKGLKVELQFGSGTIAWPSYVAGLFGACSGANIKNIALEDVSISLASTSGYEYNSKITADNSIYVGALVGYAADNTVIYNTHVSGKVSGKSSGEGCSPTRVGGLIGGANTALLSYSYNNAAVTSTNSSSLQAYNAYAGGLIGTASKELVIDKCFNSAEVTGTTGSFGDAIAGGLVSGTSDAATTITDSYNKGTVKATSGEGWFCDDAFAGGISADFKGTIDRVYNSGSVSAKSNDPYGISNYNAYAGGLCAKAASGTTINNSAQLNATVSAAASGTTSKYCISNGGTKTNNIALSSMQSGVTSDANSKKTVAQMKKSDPYTDTLAWDFESVWSIDEDIDFPYLMMVEVGSEQYDQEYIDDHIQFVNSKAYNEFMNNNRWSQIYWSDVNTLQTRQAEMLYKGAETAVDLVTLNFLNKALTDLFKDNNPFVPVLADYVNDYKVKVNVTKIQELELTSKRAEVYQKVSGYIKSVWNSVEYGELQDQSLYFYLHGDEQMPEDLRDEDIPQYINLIMDSDNYATLAGLLNVPDSLLNTIINKKREIAGNINESIDWLNAVMEYSANVESYVKADEIFKGYLEEMYNVLPEETQGEKNYKKNLGDALHSYIKYNDSSALQAKIWSSYAAEEIEGAFSDYIIDTVTETVHGWLKYVLTDAQFSALQTIGWFAEKTWKLVDYVTKNSEIQGCREMLRMNAYIERTSYNALKSVEEDLLDRQGYEDALKYDFAFKFLKETEITSIDTIISFMDAYQTSWLQAIRHLSNTFMDSAIVEAQLNKLYVYNTYCHGEVYNLGGKVITIACPTDVDILDSEGNIVVSVKDDAVDECADGLFANVVDRVKVITVPADQDYSVRISAYDDGKMIYSVSEYDENRENVQTTTYPEINIKSGNIYEGVVNDELKTDPETYDLSGIEEDINAEKHVASADTYIPVTEIVVEDQPEQMTVGDVMTLKAEIVPGDASVKSVVWKSSDEDILTVDEDGKVEAVSVGSAVLSAESLYGGVVTEFEITVVPKEDPLSSVSLAGYTTSLNGTIEMNFYMDMSDDIAADETAYMQFELPGSNHTTDKIMLTDARKSVRGGKTYYVFSAGVAAKNMVDDITATFYYSDGKKTAGPYSYTVQSYCEYIIDPKNGYDEESVALAKAMLNYGSAAQRFHDSTVADDKLANVNLSEEDKTLADASLDDSYLAETNGSCTGFDLKGSSVMTTTTTSLRHYFTVDSDLSNYTFKANGTTLTPKAYNKTLYYVEIEGIRARALDTPIQMTVTNTSDNTSYNLNYSVYTNIKSVTESNNQTDIAKDLMKSMYYYCEAAKEYFAAR